MLKRLCPDWKVMFGRTIMYSSNEQKSENRVIDNPIYSPRLSQKECKLNIEIPTSNRSSFDDLSILPNIDVVTTYDVLNIDTKPNIRPGTPYPHNTIKK